MPVPDIQLESTRPQSMLEKQAKTSKVQSEKKVKGAAQTGSTEPTPSVSPPAVTMEGEFWNQNLQLSRYRPSEPLFTRTSRQRVCEESKA